MQPTPCSHSHRLPYLSPSPAQLNDPAAQDTQIEAAVSEVVERLFCVLATLGVVPIIRCPRGGAAEHVAAQVGGGWQETRRPGQREGGCQAAVAGEGKAPVVASCVGACYTCGLAS